MIGGGIGRLGLLDWALLLLLCLGIYSEVAIQISPRVPMPAAGAGLAGLALLWRRRDEIVPTHLIAFLVVVLVYILSVLAAPDLVFLGKRFTGLVQLVYSLTIAYALFLTLRLAEANRLAVFFMGLCVTIIIGCLLESYGGLRPISDRVREILYSRGIYASDLRDAILYGRVRPKLFTSEPSAVTFCYSLFLFSWFMVSANRFRLPIFLVMLAAGLFAIPGPTSLLSVVLVVASYILLPSADGSSRLAMRLGMLGVGILLLMTIAVIGMTIYSERLDNILSGNDPSFFYRVIGPALVAREVMERFPWTGIGLTAEQYVASLVLNVYVSSPSYSAAWRINNVAEVITNYFWLHWIYLGLVFGTVSLAAVSYWLRTLRVPSVIFCWVVWVVMGQASGAYVGPKTWVVLLLAAGLSVARSNLPVPVAQRPPVPLTGMPLASRVPPRPLGLT